MQARFDQGPASIDTAAHALADRALCLQRDQRRFRLLAIALLERRLHLLQRAGVHTVLSRVACLATAWH
jgi:hypothetical protein